MKKMIFLFMCLFIISGNLYAGGVIGVEKVDTSPTATANIGKIFIKRGIEEYGDDYKLMIHSDTENGDNNFIDSIQLHQIEAYGDMLHSADEKKFGASSIQFINGDYLSISDSNDWDICGSLSGSWTVDIWFKADDATPSYSKYLISQAVDVSNRTFRPWEHLRPTVFLFVVIFFGSCVLIFTFFGSTVSTLLLGAIAFSAKGLTLTNHCLDRFGSTTVLHL